MRKLLDCLQLFTVEITLIFRQQVLFFITYIITVTTILLLTDTIGIVNNGNIMIDEQDK